MNPLLLFILFSILVTNRVNGDGQCGAPPPHAKARTPSVDSNSANSLVLSGEAEGDATELERKDREIKRLKEQIEVILLTTTTRSGMLLSARVSFRPLSTSHQIKLIFHPKKY
jgi:hypothetical protein